MSARSCRDLEFWVGMDVFLKRVITCSFPLMVLHYVFVTRASGSWARSIFLVIGCTMT